MDKKYISYILVLLYFSVFTGNIFIGLIFLLSLVSFIYKFSFKILYIVLPFFCYFSFIAYQEDRNFKEAPTIIEELSVQADTIDVNGDQLSFDGFYKNKKYKAFYKLKSEREQVYFKELKDNVVLKISSQVEIADEKKNFDTFDYQDYLKKKNIYRIVNIDNINKISMAESKSPIKFLQKLRRQAFVFIDSNFPHPQSMYMKGLLFGNLDRSFDNMRESYTSLGIVHLFALSGMHINIFFSYIRKLLLALNIDIEQVNKILVVLSLIYAVLTNFSISVLRSLFQKNLTSFNIKGLDNFSITMLVFMIIMPKFLLTTAGVLTFYFSFIISMLSKATKNLPLIKQYLVMNLLLQIAIFPILISFFYEFQPLSIIFTSIFTLIFAKAILPMLLTSLMFSLLLKVNLSSLNIFFNLLENFVLKLSQVVPKPLVFGRPSIFQLICLLVISLLIIDSYRKRTRRTVLLILYVLLVVSVKVIHNPLISMINVGQGDSILLQDSFNKNNMLIDVGGRLEIKPSESWKERKVASNAQRTLIPVLKSRGISRIDTLVISHAHADHMGDLDEIISKFKVKSILLTEGSYEKKSMQRKLENYKGSIKLVNEGDMLPLFDSHLQVLYPEQKGDGGNNDSIVLHGNFWNKSYLFTGDLEKEGEELLLKKYTNLKADVLKVGHHGSNTSSSKDFIKNLDAKIALISCGKNNMYQHPNNETLETLLENGMQIYRTDGNSQINLIHKKTGWKLKTLK